MLRDTWISDVKQRLKTTIHENLTETEKTNFRLGVKVGYRLAMQHMRSRTNNINTSRKKRRISVIKVNPYINDILIEVAKLNFVTVEDILSSSRRRELVVARSIIINVLRELTPMSLPNIGQILSDRDHTTMIHHTNMKARKESFWFDGSYVWERYLQIYNQFALRKIDQPLNPANIER